MLLLLLLLFLLRLIPFFLFLFAGLDKTDDDVNAEDGEQVCGDARRNARNRVVHAAVREHVEQTFVQRHHAPAANANTGSAAAASILYVGAAAAAVMRFSSSSTPSRRNALVEAAGDGGIVVESDK